MTILRKILLVLMVVLVVVFTLGGVTYYTIEKKSRLASASETLQLDANEVVRDLEVFVQKGKDDLVMAANNPVFIEYLSLDETKEGNEYEDHILQFSDDQGEKKKEMEKWMGFFETRFKVDEMCFIDITGQEHSRLTYGKAVKDKELSSHENEAPFFEPGFAVDSGEVSVSDPYLSPDTNRWVIAFTTPIVVEGKKEAILHFEVSMSAIQEFLTEINEASHERLGEHFEGHSHEGHDFWLINSNGYIMGNSGELVNYDYEGEIKDESEISLVKIEDSFDLLTKADKNFEVILHEMLDGKNNNGEGFTNVTNDYYSYIPSGILDWKVLVTISYDEMVGVVFKKLVLNVVAMLSITLAVVLIIVGFMVRGIMKPVAQLTKVANDISQGKLDTQLKGLDRKDEIGDLSRAFNRTVVSLKLAMRSQGITKKEQLTKEEVTSEEEK